MAHWKADLTLLNLALSKPALQIFGLPDSPSSRWEDVFGSSESTAEMQLRAAMEESRSSHLPFDVSVSFQAKNQTEKKVKWVGFYDSSLSTFCGLVYDQGSGSVQDKEIEASTTELLKSLSRLDLILEAGQLDFWDLSLDSEILTFTRDWLKISESGKAFAGVSISQFLGHIHPDDRIKFLEFKDLAVRTSDTSAELAFRLKSQDSKWTWVLLRGQASEWDGLGKPTKCSFVAFNITQQKDFEDRLRLALRTAKMGIFEWDIASNRLKWDDNMFEIFGVDPSEFTGRVEDWAQTLFPEDAEATKADLDRSVKLGGLFESMFRIRTKTGMIRKIGARGYVHHDAEGKPLRMVGVNWDATSDYEKEQIILQQQSRMIESSRLSALGEMAGGVAHEINNPLAIIRGKAQLLRDRVSSGSMDQKELESDLLKIENTTDRIVRIIKSLRYFSRDAHGDMFESYPIKSIIQETLELCQERFRQNSVSLEIGEIPAESVKCRAVQLSQVLLNLLNNAFDVVRGLDEPKIRLNPIVRNNRLQITVQDNGPGVPASVKSKIFDPFFTTKEVGKGTGLGLSISKAIISEHNGTLDLVEGESWTTFRIDIPLDSGRS